MSMFKTPFAAVSACLFLTSGEALSEWKYQSFDFTGGSTNELIKSVENAIEKVEKFSDMRCHLQNGQIFHIWYQEDDDEKNDYKFETIADFEKDPGFSKVKDGIEGNNLTTCGINKQGSMWVISK